MSEPVSLYIALHDAVKLTPVPCRCCGMSVELGNDADILEILLAGQSLRRRYDSYHLAPILGHNNGSLCPGRPILYAAILKPTTPAAAVVKSTYDALTEAICATRRAVPRYMRPHVPRA